MSFGQPPRPKFDDVSGNRDSAPFWRRWGLGRSRTRWMSDFVVQTARIDRDWQNDDRRIWGTFAQGVAVGAPSFPAIAIFTGQKRDCLIRRIDLYSQFVGQSVHISTIGEGLYNPVTVGPVQYFPWCSTTRDNTLFPSALVIGGSFSALPAAFGSPALGPTYFHERQGGTVIQTAIQKTLFDWSDPPLIIPPNSLFFLQEWNVGLTLSNTFFVANIWFSERDAAM